MAYSVVAGPINFGSALSEQTGEAPSGMESLPAEPASDAAVNLAEAAEAAGQLSTSAQHSAEGQTAGRDKSAISSKHRTDASSSLTEEQLDGGTARQQALSNPERSDQHPQRGTLVASADVSASPPRNSSQSWRPENLVDLNTFEELISQPDQGSDEELSASAAPDKLNIPSEQPAVTFTAFEDTATLQAAQPSSTSEQQGLALQEPQLASSKQQISEQAVHCLASSDGMRSTEGDNAGKSVQTQRIDDAEQRVLQNQEAAQILQQHMLGGLPLSAGQQAASHSSPPRPSPDAPLQAQDDRDASVSPEMHSSLGTASTPAAAGALDDQLLGSIADQDLASDSAGTVTGCKPPNEASLDYGQRHQALEPIPSSSAAASKDQLSDPRTHQPTTHEANLSGSTPHAATEQIRDARQGESESAENSLVSALTAKVGSSTHAVSRQDAHAELSAEGRRSSRKEAEVQPAAAVPAPAELKDATGPRHSKAEHDDKGAEAMEEGSSASMAEVGKDQASDNAAAKGLEVDSPTQAELLALADAVTRLEAELACAQEAAARYEREAESARKDAAQWQEREADASAQLAAVREAYADMRSTAETAQAQLSELQNAEKGLQKQLSACTQQARASEESKMRSRLERAERAIEQERAANRNLEAALQSAQQGGAAQANASAAKAATEVAALRRNLAEASAALASQKASNKGLQIRVAELLKGSADREALQQSSAQLRQERDALLAAKYQWTTNETLLASLKAQNNTLHVTTERLVDTNSELMERLNRQSAQVAALQSALLSAQSAQATAREAPEQIPGGVRITETELELMALAEYVQELEAALKKDRAKSAGQQPALTTTKGFDKPGAGDLPVVPSPMVAPNASKQPGSDGFKAQQSHSSTGDQPQVQAAGAKASQNAGTGASDERDAISDEQVDAIKAALRPQKVQQALQKQHSKGFWGYVTDYITGADKLIQ